MNVFVDTNVLIDFVLKRENFFENAKKLFALGYIGKLQLGISALSIVNTMYVGKRAGVLTIKKRIKSLLPFVKVYGIDAITVIEALNSDWKDYEDAVQYGNAMDVYADCIVTRNKKDFTLSTLPVYTVEELLKITQK